MAELLTYNLDVYRTSTVSQDEIESPVTSCQLCRWSHFPGLLGPVHDFILSWLEQFVDKIPPANRVYSDAIDPTTAVPIPVLHTSVHG